MRKLQPHGLLSAQTSPWRGAAWCSAQQAVQNVVSRAGAVSIEPLPVQKGQPGSKGIQVPRLALLQAGQYADIT